MRRLSLLIVCLNILQINISGQTANYKIKGIIADRNTKEQLVGANITISSLKRNTIAGLDGTYSFQNVAKGKYKIVCSFIGYQSRDTVISVNNNTVLNFYLRDAYSELSTITVSGKKYKESEVSAKKDEQNSQIVSNIVSAKSIQLSPDIIIANVLQRVSGVSLERSSSGEGRYAIIRGMDQRYNYTLINGIKIPSPDNKNRYVPLDIFPSDLVERVEVSKALTPDMEADAIGGSVNMIMKNAASRLYVNASLSTGYNQNLFKKGYDYFPSGSINLKSPFEAYGPSYSAKASDFTRDNLNYTKKNFTPNAIASLSIGNRFFNNMLGVMLGASFQNTFRGNTGIFNPSEYYDETNKEGSLRIKHSNIRNYSSQLTRIGLNAKIDFAINEKNKISLYVFNAILNDAQTRMTTDTLQPPPRVGTGTGQVWNYGRSKYQHQSIYNSTLQGNHNLSKKLNFEWTTAYSVAKNNIPDLAEYEYDNGYFADGTSSVPYQHANKVVDYHRIWERTSDRDIAGYARLAYANNFKDIPFTLTIGGMHRSKHRDNLYQDYELRTIPNPDGSFQLWTDIYHFNWSVFNPNGSPANPNSYRADENISAGYAMLKFNYKKLETLAGVRMENTDQQFDTDLPVTLAGKSGKITYSDVLPSIHLKYLLNNQTNLRLSYFSSINRPGYFEIIPTNKKGDEYDETGNPLLKHAKADNIDFRYEYFPKPNEQILFGIFYKNIANPIEFGFVGQKADQYQPANFGSATNYGFELVYEKYINKFGLRLNYTYTNSSITTNKIETFNNIRIEPAPSETRPLQGQSAHIANAALLYKNIPLGIDMQLAWQFTGKRIALVSPYYGFDQWQKDLNMFDFSAEKKFKKNFGIFIKIQNILNTPDEFYVNKPFSNTYPVPFEAAGSPQTLSKRNLYGQNYQIGLRFIL
jgi:hypothetical protein